MCLYIKTNICTSLFLIVSLFMKCNADNLRINECLLAAQTCTNDVQMNVTTLFSNLKIEKDKETAPLQTFFKYIHVVPTSTTVCARRFNLAWTVRNSSWEVSQLQLCSFIYCPQKHTYGFSHVTV